VAIHESHGTPRAVPTVLRDLYGLTPAETRLAALLTTGIGLPEASIQLGIKRETGRSQLKSIFTKTNTSTQAQLAHLLTRLGSVLAEAGSSRWQQVGAGAAGLVSRAGAARCRPPCRRRSCRPCAS
jgi:DNA-binding CsgD family transcriptional regulator